MNKAHPSTRRVQSRPWCLALVAAWVAGALLLSAPFNLFWRLGHGNFGHNILISLGCVLIGIASLVPCSLWFAGRLRDARGSNALGAVLGGGFAVFAGCAGSVLFWGAAQLWYWVGMAVMVAALVLVLVCALKAAPARGRGRTLAAWMRRRWCFNGAFWIGVFLIMVARDVYSLWDIEGLNALERASSMLGRVATSGVLAGALMLLYHGIRALTPKNLRPFVMVLASLIPCLLIYDFCVREQWGQSMLGVVNMFTSTGSFDLEREIAASGIDWSVEQVIAAALASVGVSIVLFLALGNLSERAGARTVNRHVFRALLVCWLVAVAEGGLSHATKRVDSWQRSHNAFGVHVAIFAPPVGLDTMQVSFAEPGPEADREALLAEVQDSPKLRKPDIYVFMVESWRSDSVTPEVAPFLSAFRDNECQQLGRTFAGSNCTPLSWFSFFHSRVALHWSEALAAVDSGAADSGAYPLRVLDKLGYEMHVRAVCDLGYKSMGSLNFGKGAPLADRFIDDSNRKQPSTIPIREQAAMSDLFEHLETDPTAPQFHFTALDSPHYNYYWPDGFRVLHENCASSVPHNLRPGQDVVDDVIRRYENSVHWVDAALEEFVDFLKFKGRYEDSVIIITGDHGEEFQEEGSWFHCSALNRYQTEVPIIVKWPTWVGETPSHTNVSHMDVMPSVMQLIGLEPKYYQTLSGRSLLEYDEQPREAVISTFHRGETGIGLCVVRGERKAKFVFAGPWSMNIPTKLHFTGLTDLSDKSVDARVELGDGEFADSIKAGFPIASDRFFERFESE